MKRIIPFLILLPHLHAASFVPNLGAYYGSPTRASIEYGAFYPMWGISNNAYNYYGLRGSLEAGLSGSKAIVGIGLNSDPELYSGHVIPHNISLNAFILRTYNNPIEVSTDKFYFGLELRMGILLGGKIGIIISEAPVFTYSLGILI